MIRRVFVSSLFVGSLFANMMLFGYQYAPEMGNLAEFEATFATEAQRSRKIDLHDGYKHKHLYANIAKADLLFTFDPEWSAELEFQGVKTSKISAALDSSRFILRKQFLNDATGDLLSVTAGAAFGLINRRGLHDFSLMHHGQLEAVAHIAIGREFDFWLGCSGENYFRPWIASFIGTANKASLWLRNEAHFETALGIDTHHIDIFAVEENGLGNDRLHTIHGFDGYTHIAYRFVDIGVGYCYNAIGYCSFFANAKKRLHGKYCPTDTQSLEVGIDIPFSF